MVISEEQKRRILAMRVKRLEAAVELLAMYAPAHATKRIMAALKPAKHKEPG